MLGNTLERIIVLLKDIPELTEIKFDPVDRKPVIKGVKRRINDLDKRALEAAIKLKEQHQGEIVALSMGDEKTKTAMLEALAIGADSLYLVNDELFRGVDSSATSKVLSAAIKKIGRFDAIICGEMSLESLSSQMGPRLAELLDLPQMIYAKNVDIVEGRFRVERDLEEVSEEIESAPPVVISVVREINDPRIPSLMNIMKAKRKPTTEWNAIDLGLSEEEVRNASSIKILKVEAPLVERKKVIIEAETPEEAAQKLAETIIAEGILEGI